MSGPLGSIIIAAHDEEAVIARTLRHLTGVVSQGLVDVVVVCNGCTDKTADVARGFAGVRVRELAHSSKVAALREGDLHAVPGPRIYLDADIEMTATAAVATFRALRADVLAGRPPQRFETAGAHWVVKRWYAVRAQLPSISGALWGAGCYALSEEARSRFEQFPDVVADDLFIDSLFAPGEVTIIATDPVVVRTPRTIGDLLRIRRRGYRSQAPIAQPQGGLISPGQRGQAQDLLALLQRKPAHVLDVGVYVTVIALARLRSRLGPSPRWERDDSSRRAG